MESYKRDPKDYQDFSWAGSGLAQEHPLKSLVGTQPFWILPEGNPNVATLGEIEREKGGPWARLFFISPLAVDRMHLKLN